MPRTKKLTRIEEQAALLLQVCASNRLSIYQARTNLDLSNAPGKRAWLTLVETFRIRAEAYRLCGAGPVSAELYAEAEARIRAGEVRR